MLSRNDFWFLDFVSGSIVVEGCRRHRWGHDQVSWHLKLRWQFSDATTAPYKTELQKKWKSGTSWLTLVWPLCLKKRSLVEPPKCNQQYLQVERIQQSCCRKLCSTDYRWGMGGSIKLLDESNVSQIKTSQGNMTWDGQYEKVTEIKILSMQNDFSSDSMIKKMLLWILLAKK